MTESKKTDDGDAVFQELCAVFDVIDRPFFCFDEQLHLSYLNPAAAELYGKLSGSLADYHFSYFFDQVDVAALENIPKQGVFFDVHEKTLSGDQLAYKLHVKPIAGGRIYLVDLKLNGAASDMAVALRDSELYAQKLVNTVLDGIVTINARGIIQSFNPAAERIFQYTREEVMGRNVSYLMPEPYNTEHDDYIRHYIESGTAKVIGIGREVYGRRADGSVFPMELAVSEMKTDQGLVFVGTIKDITDRKRVESFKNEFISMVSHELRTPLTAIMGALGLVIHGKAGELPEKALGLLNIVHNNGDRLIRLINDILDLSKIEAGKMVFEFSSVAVKDLLQKALEQNQMYAQQQQIELALVGEIPDVKLQIDTYRMLQVMSNLISNAVKFSHKGATVELSAYAVDGHVRLEVRDYGQGIPDAFRKSIFSKFSQADSSDSRKNGGSGLGLSVSKAIIDAHCGQIDFVSVMGKGTQFFVDLPCHMLDDTDAHNGNGRILLVEDDVDVARTLRLMLKDQDYLVDTVGSAADARQQLAHNHYDVMLLDIRLPDQNGLELAQELRQSPRSKQLPIIVVSAYVDEHRQQLQWQTIGILDWLSKPVDSGNLMKLLDLSLQLGQSADKPSILHVEDDLDVVSFTSMLLSDSVNYVAVDNVKQARQLLLNKHFDLLLLDLVLKQSFGEELLEFIARHGMTIPVIVFSAKEPSREILENVSLYLTKSRTTNDELLKSVNEVMVNNGKTEEVTE